MQLLEIDDIEAKVPKAKLDAKRETKSRKR